MYSRSLGGGSTDFYPSKSATRKSTGNPLTSRNSMAPSTHRSRATLSSRTPNLKPHETALLQAAPDIILQFLVNTRYSGTISGNLTVRSLRLKEFMSIFTHIIRHVLPDFTLSKNWEVDVEHTLKSFGYPFPVPSKSSLASFEITETPRRCAIVMMAWLIRFIHYFNARHGFDGVLSLYHVKAKGTPDGSPPSHILPLESIYRCSLESYLDWLQNPNQTSLVPLPITSHYEEHLLAEETLNNHLRLENQAYTESIRSFRNASSEAAEFEQFKAKLLENLRSEEEKTRQLTSQINKVKAKTQEKEERHQELQIQIANADRLVEDIKVAISNQVETEADVVNLNRNRTVLEDHLRTLRSQHRQIQDDLESMHNSIDTCFDTIQTRIFAFNNAISQIQPILKEIDTVGKHHADKGGSGSTTTATATTALCLPSDIKPLHSITPLSIQPLLHALASMGITHDSLVSFVLKGDGSHSHSHNNTSHNNHKSTSHQQHTHVNHDEIEDILYLVKTIPSKHLSSTVHIIRKNLAARLEAIQHEHEAVQYECDALDREHEGLKESLAWLTQKRGDDDSRLLEEDKQFSATISELDAAITKAQEELDTLTRSTQRLTEMKQQMKGLQKRIATANETYAAEREALSQKARRMVHVVMNHVDEMNRSIAELHSKATRTKHIVASREPSLAMTIDE